MHQRCTGHRTARRAGLRLLERMPARRGPVRPGHLVPAGDRSRGEVGHSVVPPDRGYDCHRSPRHTPCRPARGQSRPLFRTHVLATTRGSRRIPSPFSRVSGPRGRRWRNRLGQRFADNASVCDAVGGRAARSRHKLSLQSEPGRVARSGRKDHGAGCGRRPVAAPAPPTTGRRSGYGGVLHGWAWSASPRRNR